MEGMQKGTGGTRAAATGTAAGVRTLDQLAPHMVGVQVWAAVEVWHFNTWAEFRAVIEERWGLMPAQCRGAFYTMRP